MKNFFVIYFVVLFSFSAYAENKGYFTIGSLQCGDILIKKEVWFKTVVRFMQGYITARNYSSSFDDLKQVEDVNINSLYFAVQKFCKNNPLEHLGSAAEDIYSELLQK